MFSSQSLNAVVSNALTPPNRSGSASRTPGSRLIARSLPAPSPSLRSPGGAKILASLKKRKADYTVRREKIILKIAGKEAQRKDILENISSAQIQYGDRGFLFDEKKEEMENALEAEIREHEEFTASIEMYIRDRKNDYRTIMVAINKLNELLSLLEEELTKVEIHLHGGASPDKEPNQDFSMYSIPDLQEQFDLFSEDDLHALDDKGNLIWTQEQMLELLRKLKKGHMAQNRDLIKKWKELKEQDFVDLQIPEKEYTEEPRIFCGKGNHKVAVFRGRIVLYFDLDV